MPKPKLAQPKNKYAEAIIKPKVALKGQQPTPTPESSDDELEMDASLMLVPTQQPTPTDKIQNANNLEVKDVVENHHPQPQPQPQPQIQQEAKENNKPKRKYTKKQAQLLAGPVETAQYNSVLERVNDLASLFVKLQEDQARLSTVVEKTVKAANAEQHKKLDNTLQESREFFAKLAHH